MTGRHRRTPPEAGSFTGELPDTREPKEIFYVLHWVDIDHQIEVFSSLVDLAKFRFAKNIGDQYRVHVREVH